MSSDDLTVNLPTSGLDLSGDSQLPKPRGSQLTDIQELLFRQVNPGWIQDGRITPQAFGPFPVDRGLLSVSRGALTTAQASYELFVGRGRQSVGVASVSVEECKQVDLLAYGDPEDQAGIEDPAHAVIDYRHLIANDKERKRKAKALSIKAQQRGFSYSP